MAVSVSKAFELLNNYSGTQTRNSEFKALYEPRNYIMDMGGKKLRGILAVMGYSLFKDDIEKSLPLAYAFELFHNFTLVHDDIMDQAGTRRGKPSVHKAFGENAAILSGDVMLIEVYERMLQLPAEYRFPLSDLMTRTAREVCEGQSLDMTFETKGEVTIDEYLRMIELKTSVLLAASLCGGALLAGASESDQNHLYNFALNAGIGFQLQDDLLDAYGDPATFGKTVGGDIIQGKKTYLFLRTLESLEGGEKQIFQELYSSEGEPAKKVPAVISYFDNAYVKHYCEEAKIAFFDLAKSHLRASSIHADDQSQLEEFALGFLNRDR
jgi:geranylgeranyl diphosphate synthase type II